MQKSLFISKRRGYFLLKKVENKYSLRLIVLNWTLFSVISYQPTVISQQYKIHNL